MMPSLWMMWDSMCFHWKESPCNCRNPLTLTSAMVWPAELKWWATGLLQLWRMSARCSEKRTAQNLVWTPPLSPYTLAPHPLICSEYLPVLEVSGKCPGKKVFHVLSSGVLHCTHYVSPLTWTPISVALWYYWMLFTARPTHRHINLAPTFWSSWGACTLTWPLPSEHD